MIRKAICILTLSASAIGLSGCSTVWNQVEGFANNVYRFVVPLRGSEDTTDTDVQMADSYISPGVSSNASPQCPDGTYLTSDNTCMMLREGRYTLGASTQSVSVNPYAGRSVEIFDVSSGTNPYAGRSVEIFAPAYAASTSTMAGAPTGMMANCPDGSYLTPENTCMLVSSSTYDLLGGEYAARN